MTACIRTVHAREILDSRGNPTVEVDVVLDDGTLGRAAVPSGASTGTREALELRDHDPMRYNGKGVRHAVKAVNEPIAAALANRDALDQRAIDEALINADNTETKSLFGANAILGVSMAVARAAAAVTKQPLYRYLATGELRLPVPMVNVINGGVHAANALDFQEFMLTPVGAPSTHEGIRFCAEVFHQLKKILQAAGHSIGVGDEGGYAPNLKTAEEAIQMLVHAIEVAGYKAGRDISIALDPAASELYHDEHYTFAKSSGAAKTTQQMIDLYADLIDRYPIVSIEDGLAEQDWGGWKALTARIGDRVMLVGDDIFVTNPAIIRRGITEKIGNATLIKLNQIGTVTETLEAIAVSRAAGYRIVISHRSGETEDTFIADLAVAVGADFIKTGSMARSERLAKYNQLMRIEEELGSGAVYDATPEVRV